MILKKLALMSLLLFCMVKARAMQEDLGYVEGFAIKAITRYVNDNCKTYYATLSNRDSLSATRFRSGPMKGEIRCTRWMEDVDGSFCHVSVDADYFKMFKLLYTKNGKKK